MVRRVPVRDSVVQWHPEHETLAESSDAQASPLADSPVSSHTVRMMVIEIQADLVDLEKFYNVSISETRYSRLLEYMNQSRRRLQSLPFSALNHEAKVDYILLRNYLDRRIRKWETDKEKEKEFHSLLQPWANDLVQLIESRQKAIPPDRQGVASTVATTSATIRKVQSDIASGKLTMKGNRTAAFRAASILDELHGLMVEWYGFYEGYDPLFTWWVKQPWTSLSEDLTGLGRDVREKLVGIVPGDEDAIVGQPIGRDGILADLEAEVIPYSPEQLIEIGENEYKWCEQEMIKASKDLGFGKDWRRALEHVKNMYVPPGDQAKLVHELAEEAVQYVQERDMVTIPPIANEAWRTFMMSPERQKANPFFLGGPYILISYPTDTMSHEDKLMSMRGNSRPFSRSTVFHELIPGHHLQFHYIARHKTYRNMFTTPFWMEGWAFYWEFILWDRGFPDTPENKIGMLFWRMHRCARIIFSLKFHLGKWTPQHCIDFLVEKVGHERLTAEGEVRRSFNGDYTPLYQAGYMLGALQLYELRRELVDEGGMREKDFHDRILRENQMPIEMLRALLKGEHLTSDQKPSWRFYEGRQKVASGSSECHRD